MHFIPLDNYKPRQETAASANASTLSQASAQSVLSVDDFLSRRQGGGPQSRADECARIANHIACSLQQS